MKQRLTLWGCILIAFIGISPLIAQINSYSTAKMLTNDSQARALILSSEERHWLSQHPQVRVGVDSNSPPYSFINEQGKPVGFAIDMLELIGKKTNIEFIIDDDMLWQEIVNNLEQKNIDLILTMVETPERAQQYLFTAPIAYKSLVIVANKNVHHIDSRGDIANKTVALVRNYHYVDKILAEFPNMTPYYVDSMREALEVVEIGSADAAITFFAAANFLQQHYLFTQLKFAAFYDINSANESIAIRQDMPLLASIMEKGIQALSADEKWAINEKWHANIDLPTNNETLIEVAIVSGILIFILMVWLLQEKRHSRVLSLAKQGTDEANKELNSLKADLEVLISDRTVQLKISENRYRGLVESLEDEYVFYQHDSQGIIQYISPSVTHILGHQVSGFGINYRQYLTDYPNNHLIPSFVERSLKGEHVPPFEIEVFDSKGDIHSFEVLERPMYDEEDNCIGCEGIAHDITVRKQHQEKLHRLSHFDDLTGLANRYSFKLILEEKIKTAQALEQHLALLFLDLTRFKIINDNLGHSAGDHIIQQAAQRILASITPADTVSRFGGDKFCVLLPHYSAIHAKSIAQSLIQSFSQPFEVHEQTFILGCRIGVSLFPANEQDAETLLKQADSALYVAKKLPSGLAFCSKEQTIYNKRRLKLEQGLRLAIASPRFDGNYELSPVFQSLNRLPEGRFAGFEALMRWHHPELGPISPSEFSPSPKKPV
jgi:diguanylate cyclase (GGDEF)-like protein/PAS domain S-box-containing protein